MSYLIQISNDILNARKARDSLKVKSLTMLKSKLLDNSKAPKPKEELAIVRMYLKQVGESRDAYAKNSDKYENELLDAHAEYGYIKSYLPEELSDDAIRAIVVNERYSHWKPDDEVKFGMLMGKVMKYLKSNHDGQADGKVVKRIIEEVLEAPPINNVETICPHCHAGILTGDDISSIIKCVRCDKPFAYNNGD